MVQPASPSAGAGGAACTAVCGAGSAGGETEGAGADGGCRAVSRLCARPANWPCGYRRRYSSKSARVPLFAMVCQNNSSGSIPGGGAVATGAAGVGLGGEVAGGGAVLGASAAVSAGAGDFCRSETRYQPVADNMPRTAIIEAPIR